jgi:hypothetical protein
MVVFFVIRASKLALIVFNNELFLATNLLLDKRKTSRGGVAGVFVRRAQ